MESVLLRRLKNRFFALPSRCARPASLGFNLFKTSVQSLVLWLVFLLAAPLGLSRLETLLRAYGWPFARFVFPFPLALLIFCLGALVAWSSAWALVRYGDGTPLPIDATNKLVVWGPYRWIRNPMATASLTQGAAVGLALGSPLILLYIVAAGFLWHFTVRYWEEHDMEARFGADFLLYKSHVRCWLPRLHPYSTQSNASS